jgi:hypothetical protein
MQKRKLKYLLEDWIMYYPIYFLLLFFVILVYPLFWIYDLCEWIFTVVNKTKDNR